LGNAPVVPVTEIHSPEAHVTMDAASARLMRLATYASVSVAVVLICAKLVAWYATDSVSVFSTLIDSLLDGAASMVSLLAVRHALEPADKEHRFGHGKAESLAGLAQSAFICGSAVFLLMEAGERLLHPRDIANLDIGFLVMGISIVLTGVLVSFQRYVVARTGSVAIAADSLHYKMDVLVNFGVIGSLAIVSQLGWLWADPVIAVVIAGYIIHGAWSIASASLQVLMDQELPDDERLKIRDIALAHSDVHGIHDLRTRSSGLSIFIQLHLELDGDMTLMRAHEIADEVEDSIMVAYPNAEVITHQDPEGIDEPVPVFR
jgi:ferrous-iron efflux pump FieF